MYQIDQDILVGEVVQIRNFVTGTYLTATGFHTQEKGLLFGSTVNINNYYVVGSDDPNNYYTLWTIVKVFDDSNRINYGDVVYFKNLSTKISIQKFLIKLGFPWIRVDQKITLSYCNNWESKYSKQRIMQLRMDYYQRSRLQSQLISQRHHKRINDKIIIRNYKSGYSLHSHKNIYASTGMQEVTCFSYERDANDWWVIQQTFQMAQKQIQDQMPINLIHQETNKYLCVDEKNLAKSKNGNQVSAMQSSMQQSLIISTIDNEQLIVGKPFYFLYYPLNKYLCQGSSLSEMQSTQYEVILTNKLTTSCLWIVEKVIK